MRKFLTVILRLGLLLTGSDFLSSSDFAASDISSSSGADRAANICSLASSVIMEDGGITLTVTSEGGMQISAAANGDETIKRSTFMIRSVGNTCGNALLGDDLVAATKVNDRVLLRMDDDALTWMTIRLEAAANGFLNGATRTVKQMLGQYRDWLQRRIDGNWGHGLFGLIPDGRVIGWILADVYDENTIKVKNETYGYVDASSTEMYREAFRSQPYRMALDGWLAAEYRTRKGFGSWALYTYIYNIMPQVDERLETEIILTVAPDNEAGIGLLSKLGFDRFGGEFYREGKPGEYLKCQVWILHAKNIPDKKARVAEIMYRKR